MPTYDTECKKCGANGEHVSTIADRDDTPPCKCGGKTVRVILTAPKGYVDFPAASGMEYVSPTSGKRIGSKRERVEDMKRTGSRPYEGREQEEKQARRYRDECEKKSDAALLETAKEVYQQLPLSKRQELEG